VSLLDDFMLRAAAAGVGAALAAGPLGCFVVWRRMAYFGDATAHAAVLGVALSLALDVPVMPGVLIAALAMAGVISAASGRSYAADTLLGVCAHGALAAGLVAAALGAGPRLDLEALLFGDILAVSAGDVGLIWAGAAGVLALVALRWRSLVTATLSADLAAAEGHDPRLARLTLMLALALVVAVALKVVGALLITALLVIPAAAARPLSASPVGMAVAACAIGAAAALGGLAASWSADAPTGPSIVLCAAFAFVTTNLLGALRGAAPR